MHQAFQTAMGLFKPNAVFFLGQKEILNDKFAKCESRKDLTIKLVKCYSKGTYLTKGIG
jgi:hypothetical protein